MSQSVYFEAGAPDVRVITEPDVNLQPTARSCCASCHDIPACSAFQWCAGYAATASPVACSDLRWWTGAGTAAGAGFFQV